MPGIDRHSPRGAELELSGSEDVLASTEWVPPVAPKMEVLDDRDVDICLEGS